MKAKLSAIYNQNEIIVKQLHQYLYKDMCFDHNIGVYIAVKAVYSMFYVAKIMLNDLIKEVEGMEV